ncbi:MAG: hypothetical protein ACW98J_05030 [Candidatus Thorarchaeota archaeon]|jgi:hypothetical protein
MRYIDITRGLNLPRESVLVILVLSIACVVIVPVEAVIDDDYLVIFDLAYDIDETHYFGYSGERHYSDVETFGVNISRNSLSSILSELTIYGYPLWLDVDSLEEGQILLIDRKNYTMSLVDGYWEGWTIGFYRAADSDIFVYYDQELGFLESVVMHHLQPEDEWWAMLIQLRSDSMSVFDEFREPQVTPYDYNDAVLMSIVGIELTVLLLLFILRRTESRE